MNQHAAADSRHRLDRRAFLGLATLAALAAVRAADPSTPSAPATPLPRAPRPKPPYRAWFQPLLFERDASLYAHMNVEASGWLDPRLAALAGVAALDWVYGPNHPDAGGPDYWRDACTEAGRTHPRKNAAPGFVSAGIAIDEWVPPKQPDNVRWMSEGLRAGRRANPEVFIAAWSTDPGPALFDLGRDGTIDLFIVEGYTHSVKAGLSTSWDNALRRCESFAAAGLEARTIFGFGHINAEKSHRGTRLDAAWLGERMAELRKRFPAMPGVAFFETQAPDTPDRRDLIRACDRLSAGFWPDAKGG